MSAYYNEIDPKAAAWLRELIKQGHIADGTVDERSIVDVKPEELREFTQCHFFAGIGVWSYALRRSGWEDDRPVWTGSCPCQPFSAAGKGNGFADERHLWPAFYHLIENVRPVTVFGEQVASKDGLGWLDLVQTDLEGTGYAFGALDSCAAGVGAPHIRQRLYWVADTGSDRGHDRRGLHRGCAQEGERGETTFGSQSRIEVEGVGSIGDLANAKRNQEHEEQSRPAENERGRRTDEPSGCSLVDTGTATGPTNGFWRDADWLFCRDGKWRPVEPAFKQMVDGLTCSMVYLRDSSYAEEKERVMNETERNPYAREAMREMRETNSPEAVWLKTGGQIGFYEATLLFAFLLEREGKLGRILNGETQGVTKIRENFLREMRKDRQSSSSSFGREYTQQLSGELADTLSRLPQTPALELLKTLNGSPLAHGASARVGRLRGYGNAINAAQAEGFITAFMDEVA